MKKSLICVSVLIVLILGYCAFELVYLKKAQTQVETMVEEIKEASNKNKVVAQVTEFSNYLTKHKNILPLLVPRDHVEIIMQHQHKIEYFLSINDLRQVKENAAEIGCLFSQLL